MYIKIEKKEIEFNDCITFFHRLKGYMFHLETIDTGLRFPKCKSIHTFFMFQKIDIVMTDVDDKILYLYPNFGTERILFPKKNVYYTYELPLGSIDTLSVGAYLRVFTSKKKTSQ